MKKFFTFLIVCILSAAWSLAETEDPEKEPIAVSSFIPMEQQDLYQDMINRALEAFEAKNYEKSLAALDEAIRLFPKDPFPVNLRGAIFTKQKDFIKARDAFEKALALDPTFFPARFNIGETYFLEGKMEEALRYFEVLRENYRDNELLKFKLVVLFFKTGRNQDAERTMKRMRYPGEGPAWYYAQAVAASVAGNKSEMRKHIKTAHALFGKKKCEFFDETLTEAGYLN
jgi:Flp pilus assembly protein TadD